jgi:hypothetical protein
MGAGKFSTHYLLVDPKTLRPVDDQAMEFYTRYPYVQWPHVSNNILELGGAPAGLELVSAV